MKVYVNKAVGRSEEINRSVLIRDLELKGIEVTPYIAEADTIFRYANDYEEVINNLSYNGKDKKEVFVYEQDKYTGKINVYNKENSCEIGYYIRTAESRKSVTCPMKPDDIKKLSADIINYITGKTNELVLVDPLPLNALYSLIDIYIETGRNNSNIEQIKTKYNINETDIEVIRNEVNGLTKYGKECELLIELRKVKSIWTMLPIQSGIKGLIISNNSDNIIINLVNARMSSIFFSKTKDETKRKNTADKYNKAIGNVITTARSSMFGTNKGFQTYCKIDQEQNGVYGLFIVDNELADGEVLVPHPANMDLNSARKEISFMGNKHEVIFLYNRKTIIINGPEAKKLRAIYRNGNYSYYKIYINSDKKLNIKDYPEIGDEVVVTRHPVTTMVLRLRVVGYTKSCSIRVNSKTALALYGDSDGDSFVVSWSKWTDKLKLHGVVELNEFCKAAGIEMDTTEYKNEFDINDFLSLEEDDEETCLIKSSESGLEQAKAKLMTKSATGEWGAAEMSLVQTAIINNMYFDMDMIYRKSLLSQVLVQAKNILAELQSGNGLSDEVKETIVLMSYLKGNTMKASRAVSNLLDITENEAINLINELKGIALPKEIIEEKKVDEDDFFKENIDIIMQR